MADEHKDESTFSFGEYISPNPKPIPLGRFKPEPSVSYQIKKIIKYDSPQQVHEENKEQSQDASASTKHSSTNCSQSIKSTNTAGDQVHIDSKSVTFSSPKHKVAAPTPAKVKVKKQAKQIEDLQAELERLRFENLKLKSQSTSPNNEVAVSNEYQERSLSFNPSVNIVSDSTASLKNTTLHDKVSVVRSQRSATPYKSKKDREHQKKQKQQGHQEASSMSSRNKVLRPTMQHQASRNQVNQQRGRTATRGHQVVSAGGGGGEEAKGKKSSRQQYRITPIPTKKRKSTKFKSKLKSIEQSEKENISHLGLDDEAPTPRDLGKVKKFATPSQSAATGGGGHSLNKPAEQTMSRSFDFGRDLVDTPSETPSFSSSVGSSFLGDDTPDFMKRPRGHAKGQHRGILTPVRGAESGDNKPFSFDWNKK